MLQQILNRLPGDFPWQSQIHWYDTIESTNTAAKSMALSGAPHGTVLVAGHQTGGRGRMGRSFHSPVGMGVYMTILLRPQCKPEQLMHLTCATAVAMCDAVENAARFRPQVKWTNDLVVGTKKLGGILTELVFSPTGLCAIVGIGINARQKPEDFPEELRQIACSAAMVSGTPLDTAALAASMIQALYRMDQRLLSGKSEILAQYRRDCITPGKEISILRADQVQHATALDINDDGALIVRFPDGQTETVNSGEVSIRGMYGYV